MDGNAYLKEIAARYREQKSLAERAVAQLGDEALFARLDPESNSIAHVMKHLGGNLRSRWTDFLSSDGEKPDRKRDTEFDAEDDTRASIQAVWDGGWAAALGALDTLRDDDVEKSVVIRGQPHAVYQAISRNLAHTAHHVGQIVLLAKHFAGERWKTLSIPRGKSEEFEREMRERNPPKL